MAAEYGADKAYTEMDAFLADDEVNFVYIATPNLLHEVRVVTKTSDEIFNNQSCVYQSALG